MDTQDDRRLGEAFRKLREQSPSINVATDRATKAVAAVSEFLKHKCRLDVEHWVSATGTPVQFELGYAPWNGEFLIQVRQLWSEGVPDELLPGGRIAPVDCRPWCDWSREVRLQSFLAMPALLCELADRVEAEFTRITPSWGCIDVLARDVQASLAGRI